MLPCHVATVVLNEQAKLQRGPFAFLTNFAATTILHAREDWQRDILVG